MANIERLRQVLQAIKDNPQHWDQRAFHCNTSHCFAGFADCLASGISFKEDTKDLIGYDNTCLSFLKTGDYVHDVARKWLDLSPYKADLLFHWKNDLEDLEIIIEKIERNLL